MNLSRPVAGMIIGMLAGVPLGLMAVSYLGVTGLMDQVALGASVLLITQLLGASIGAAMGKPHE